MIKPCEWCGKEVDVPDDYELHIRCNTAQCNAEIEKRHREIINAPKPCPTCGKLTKYGLHCADCSAKWGKCQDCRKQNYADHEKWPSYNLCQECHVKAKQLRTFWGGAALALGALGALMGWGTEGNSAGPTLFWVLFTIAFLCWCHYGKKINGYYLIP